MTDRVDHVPGPGRPCAGSLGPGSPTLSRTGRPDTVPGDTAGGTAPREEAAGKDIAAEDSAREDTVGRDTAGQDTAGGAGGREETGGVDPAEIAALAVLRRHGLLGRVEAAVRAA